MLFFIKEVTIQNYLLKYKNYYTIWSTNNMKNINIKPYALH